MVLLEVCCTNIESALNMLREGAQRVELCSVLECGGLTPTWLPRLRDRSATALPANPELKLFATEDQNLDLLSHAHVLIRCRPGDFCYSQAEVDEMCKSIRLCREISVKGVVIGALTPEGDPDLPALRKMIHVATGPSATLDSTGPDNTLTLVFHRAFDECRDPFSALEQIISLGFNTLLTSGHAPTAEQGIPILKQLVERAAGRINIMAGKGVTLDNVARIIRETGVPAVHLSEREGIFKLLRHIQNANS
jgi:copper homeostasis protein